MQMNDFPPTEAYAPRTNCACPPVPLMWRWPADSLAACPCRSICVVLLIATTRSFCMTAYGWLVRSTAWHRKSGLPSAVLVLHLRPDPEGAHDLAGVERLLGAGDDASAVEVDDAVGEPLGVDAQLTHAALAHQRADGVRHRSDADLQAAAVVDLGGDQLRDGAVGIAGSQVRDLRE